MKSVVKKLFGKDSKSLNKSGIEVVYFSGLFDHDWYLETNPDVAESGVNPLEHYYFNGYKEGRTPNYLFDPAWYLSAYPDVLDAGIEPLEHYIKSGEAEGRQPSLAFDPEYYKNTSSLPDEESALKHYLENAKQPICAPTPFFDPAYYLQQYQDIKEAGLDPYKHFLLQGCAERRNPSTSFDTGFYIDNHLGGNVSEHAYYHYLSVGKHSDLRTLAPAPGETTSASAQALICSADEEFLKAGPGFEDFKYGSRQLDPEVKAIAYYLPQFHPFEENNEWWGQGFTEWTNVTRARSRFNGHYQPHLPRDLGFYDLRVKDTLVAQAKMARDAGLEGFCFYHYWFNGRRLMDGPVNLLLENTDIELPFCLMWANENWTRTWDGFDNDVLIAQDYRDEDDVAFVADIARHFTDSRYISIDGRPLFFIYRPGIIPKASEKIALWRRLFRDNHNIEPLIYMAQAFGDLDPREYGLDGAIEFPPHKVAEGLPSVAQSLGLKDAEFVGHYPSYEEMSTKSLNDCSFDYDVIKAVTPMWDNEARKPKKGMGFVGATPEKYERWLKGVAQFAKENPIQGKHKFVAINAWNEWAEGAHLEPDQYWGSAYLNSTYRALHEQTVIQGKYSLILVGHDAYKHGAQLLTLNIFKTLKQQFGIDVRLVLLDGGPLVSEYEKVGETHVCHGSLEVFDSVVRKLKEESGLNRAICNTTVSGKVAPILAGHDIDFISLIHELKNLVQEYKLEKAAQDIADHAQRVVFAAEAVKDSFVSCVDSVKENKLVIHPQGIYQDLFNDSSAYRKIRKELGISKNAKLIVNVGYADLRKGFDIFVNVAKLVVEQHSNYHFIWIGDIEPSLKHWLSEDLGSELLKNNFHNIPFTNEISSYLLAADAFAMTSREDPFPSVVMESLALGTPVIGFEGGGGFTELLEDKANGEVVPMANIGAMAESIIRQIATDSDEKAKLRGAAATSRFKWDEYVFSLVEYLDPAIKRVSVAVPNYNYEDHIEERLRSIFDQSYPVFEINVLDDKSPDNSVSVIEAYAKRRNRKINLVVNKKNSGSVFKQWKKGADVARAKYLWVAEADDSADNLFLQKILEGPTNFTLAYTDSKQIDEKDKHLADDYRYYYDQEFIDILDRPGIYDGTTVIDQVLSIKNQFMNVSSMLFDTTSFVNCLENSLDNILEFKVAGDWYIYVDLLSKSNSKVKVVSAPMNIHRRHSASVTKKNYDVQLDEIKRVQTVTLKFSRNSPDKQIEQNNYLSEVKKVLEG
ncbi:glycoside hydrolase family 99-like domain-containing protein [Microbulbifer sp. ANSA003]|uniref:glycoside hydrolase family 99-like domain-containing protein n=1 Tax=Microbulbifer sp. ANSA003 TaxID=3243360 RepID=UPI0040413BFE